MPLTMAQHGVIDELEELAKEGAYTHPTDALYLIRCIKELEKEATNGND
jgi:hypothetical protein